MSMEVCLILFLVEKLWLLCVCVCVVCVEMEEMAGKVVEMEEKMVKLQKVLDQEKVKKVEAINKLADVSYVCMYWS